MRRLVLILALLASGTASALTVPVRSGEHDGFSRLVMQLPESANWSISRTDRFAQVRVNQTDIRFDTSRVFELIPRNRLENLFQAETGASLDLTLNCDCEIKTSTMGGGYLIIDISDPKPETFTLQPILPFGSGTPYRFSLARDAAPSLPLTAGALRTTPALPADPAEPGTALDAQPVVGNRLSEQRLLAQIERAAAQGLLTPVMPANPRSAPAGSDSAETGNAPTPTPRNTLNISATTVIDRDMSGVADRINAMAGAGECLPSGLVALQDWGNEQPFAAQVGPQRAALFGEFDKLDVEAAKTLAKTYLYFGFGAEAQAVLDLLPEHDLPTRVQSALASVLDDRPLPPDNPLAGQSGCHGDIALWAVLAQPDQVREIAPDAFLQGFSQLPRHIRRHLGPRLSQILNASGQSELARAILRAIDRSTDATEPAEDLAEAEIDSSTGNIEAAAEKMTDVVDGGSEYSPQALVGLIDTHLVERKPLRPDLPDLAGAYAAEHRLGDLGPELRRAHAIALALTGQFDESAAEAGKIRELDGDVAMQQAMVPLLDLLEENAGDVTFLTYAMPEIVNPSIDIPVALQTRMAERLLGLGFAEQAFALLDRDKARSQPEDRRLLRAEAALANDLPHRAMIEVLSLSGPEASDIRARAMQVNGDFERAGLTLMEVEKYEEAARNLWLADATNSLPSTEDTLQFARLAELTTQLSESTDADTLAPPLAGARMLLDDSAEARARIEELLGALPLEQVAN